MTNMLKGGFRFLKKTLLENAQDKIKILRNNEVVFEGPAIAAKSRFYDVDYSEKRIVTLSSDFIIDGDAGYIPKSGDVVVYDGAVYVVRPAANELYTYDDPYKTTLRIHTQLKGK